MSNPFYFGNSELARQVLAQDLSALTPQEFKGKKPLEQLLLAERIIIADPKYLRALSHLEIGRQVSLIQAALYDLYHHHPAFDALRMRGLPLPEPIMAQFNEMFSNNQLYFAPSSMLESLSDSEREMAMERLRESNQALANDLQEQRKFQSLEVDYKFGREVHSAMGNMAKAGQVLLTHIADEMARRAEQGVPWDDLFEKRTVNGEELRSPRPDNLSDYLFLLRDVPTTFAEDVVQGLGREHKK